MAESERLTVESSVIAGYVVRDMCSYGRDREPTDELSCEEICDLYHQDCDSCPIQNALNRLAEYENTGLSPQEIIELKERDENG